MSQIIPETCKAIYDVSERRQAHGVGRVVGALSCETGFTSSMLNKVIFLDARASLIQNLSCYAKTNMIHPIFFFFKPHNCSLIFYVSEGYASWKMT